jgi:C-terminal processing protease CtpA/Prc
MQRSELNSSGTRGVAGRLPLALLALLVAVPASAQTDSVRVRTVSTWQKDVDHLRKELLEKRRMEFELVRQLNTLERRRATAADSQRSDIRAQSQYVVNQLRETVEEQGRLRRQLESMCAEVQKPEGWLGVATTGFQLLDRQVNGPQIVRFLEPPIVASVDPGGPADRVGLRAGDELMEIGGKRLLQANVIFAELLRPGEKILVKLRRGNEIITVEPKVEPRPQVTEAPCTWVDAGTAYVIAPSPAQGRGEVVPAAGSSGFAYTYTTARRDSAAGGAAAGTIQRQPVVAASPMARMFVNTGNSLAGLELMALNPESGRAFGVTYGLFVNQVLPGTPGRQAGLQGGDVLVTADSVALRTVLSLQRAIMRSPNRAVTLSIMRRGKAETVQLKW